MRLALQGTQALSSSPVVLNAPFSQEPPAGAEGDDDGKLSEGDSGEEDEEEEDGDEPGTGTGSDEDESERSYDGEAGHGYDVNDNFIDDSEAMETPEHVAKAKHSGYFINKVRLETRRAHLAICSSLSRELAHLVGHRARLSAWASRCHRPLTSGADWRCAHCRPSRLRTHTVDVLTLPASCPCLRDTARARASPRRRQVLRCRLWQAMRHLTAQSRSSVLW